MVIVKKTYRFDNATEVEEHLDGRYGAPGQKREKKRKPTPEEMKKVNQHNREKWCRRRMRRWFGRNDLWVTLTYEPKQRPPDMETARKQFSAFLRRARDRYRRRGYVLRWMRNIERGTKNGWHIHMLVTRIPDTDLILADTWPYGTVDMKPCHKEGNFRRLAAYLTKTPETEPRLRESDYDASRNMPLRKPETRQLCRWRQQDKIRIPKGFYMDRDSFHEGTNPVTGFPYREYTLLRIKEKEAPPDAEGRHIHSRGHKGTRKGDRKGDVPDADKEKKRG